MREIKFRGKHIETGRWVYGYYVCTHNRHRIIYEDYEGFYCEEEVIPETVGQYTGLKDKNGKEIYEGDIYKKHNDIYLVIYDNGFKWQKIYDSWLERNVFSDKRRSIISEVDCSLFIEVIGNIYENPELLEGEE